VVDESVVNVVQTYLESLRQQRFPIQFGVVFGSWARGKADKYSDIDLLVVSPRFDGPVNREDVNFLWRQAARIDSRIEPIGCSERQWREDDSNAIIEIARREGECIMLAQESEIV
jgi:predicted nucleotidyltransferase